MKKINHPKISIIVPVYNVSCYIERCAKSLFQQTFFPIEIIFIDDGSKDDSMQKLRFLIGDKSFVKIITQKNQGLSAARNAGIKIAKGDYLAFVDSDDVISPNFCEATYQKAKESNADVVFANRNNCNENGIYSMPKVLDIDNNIKDKKNRLRLCLFGRLSWTAWGKLYKKELFANKLFTVGRYYEDIILIPQIVASAESITFAYLANYFYYRRKEAITSGSFSKKHLDDQIFAIKCAWSLAKQYQISWSERLVFLLVEFKYEKYIENFGYLTTYKSAKKIGYNFLLYCIIYRCIVYNFLLYCVIYRCFFYFREKKYK